ncbi:MAG: sulfite exporter TauE/SafE family protein [Gammaproteobacteria bacterium]|nr:MAG: sulfite exporter TauE/SafE family protein [Gammaproteobacteria bacterium]
MSFEYIMSIAWLLVLLGFVVGTLSGFFGVGGAFIMTPALNILGFPIVYAIGTDLALMLGSSTVATVSHFRFGNVDIRLGLYMVFGTALGVWLGKSLVFFLLASGIAETVIRIIYILLLFSLSIYMIYDYIIFITRPHVQKGRADAEKRGTRLSRRLQQIKLPPMVKLPTSGIRQISIWIPLGVGVLTGFLAGFLGVGGGFIRMPTLIYGLGVPTSVAVGTDLFEIVFSSAFGTFVYGIEGKVHLLAAMILLLGASLGAQVGSYATRYVRGMRVRLYFALTLFFAGVSVVLKQVGVWRDIPLLSTLAGYLIVGVASIMMVIIVIKLIVGLATRPAHKKARRL